MIVHPHTTIHLAEHVSAISQFLKRDSVSISQYSTPYLIIKGGQCEFTNEKRQFKKYITISSLVPPSSVEILDKRRRFLAGTVYKFDCLAEVRHFLFEVYKGENMLT